MSAELQVDPWEAIKGVGERGSTNLVGAISKETSELLQRARQLRGAEPPSSVLGKADDQAEKIFNALVSAKVATSKVSMHLTGDWRKELFRQLDALHDVAEWEVGDKPVNGSSYETFLRAFLALRAKQRPGLGLTTDGNLIGAWTEGSDRLTLEFLPGNQVQWILSRAVMGKVERAAGVSWVKRLAEVLAPYDPNTWFKNEERSDSR